MYLVRFPALAKCLRLIMCFIVVVVLLFLQNTLFVMKVCSFFNNIISLSLPNILPNLLPIIGYQITDLARMFYITA